MKAFLCASICLLAAWVVHLIGWRLRRPRHHTAALLLIFLVVPAAAIGLVLAAGWSLRIPPTDLPGMALFYLGAVGCYLIVYAGVEETSPSLVVIRALERAGSAGCRREELAALVDDDSFVRPRIAALQRDGLVALEAAGGRLTPAGRRAARAAVALAAILNIHDRA